MKSRWFIIHCPVCGDSAAESFGVSKPQNCLFAKERHEGGDEGALPEGWGIREVSYHEFEQWGMNQAMGVQD